MTTDRSTMDRYEEERIVELENRNRLEAQHTELVRVLCKPGAVMAAEMTPEKAHLWHMVTCIAGEAGELIDTVKRWVIYGKPLDELNLVEELGDLEFYLRGLRAGANISREETLANNVRKLSKRYAAQGGGIEYTDASAIARADKVDDGSRMHLSRGHDNEGRTTGEMLRDAFPNARDHVVSCNENHRHTRGVCCEPLCWCRVAALQEATHGENPSDQLRAQNPLLGETYDALERSLAPENAAKIFGSRIGR